MKNPLVTNTIIDKLKGQKEGKPVMLEGYVEVDNSLIRLYLDFSLQNYVEVPQEAIVHVVSASEDDAKTTRVLVNPSAEIRLVNAIKAGDILSLPEPAQDATVVLRQRGGSGPVIKDPPIVVEPGGGIIECYYKAREAYLDSRDQCINAGYSKEFCEEAARGTFRLAFEQCLAPKKA